MPSDPELQSRGRLIRSLGALREMLPGSFVERKRACGRPNCHCADGKNLQVQFQISVLVEGKPKTFNVPAKLVEQVRQKVELRRRFDAAADTIGYALQRQSPGPVFTLGCEVARRPRRNGVLRSDWSRGRMVAAVDGIEIRSSFARCCDACMQRKVQHKVRGETRTDQDGSHRPQTPGDRQPRWRASKEKQDGGGGGEHQFLRHEFRTWRDPPAVHPSTQPQPVAH
jgi:hypothetical protein